MLMPDHQIGITATRMFISQSLISQSVGLQVYIDQHCTLTQFSREHSSGGAVRARADELGNIAKRLRCIQPG